MTLLLSEAVIDRKEQVNSSYAFGEIEGIALTKFLH